MSIPEPAVKRTTLVLTAGILWVLIGIFLLGKGLANFLPFENESYLYIGSGILLGVLKSQLVFGKIIDKNVIRIKELAPHKDKICIFAFQALESYLIAIVMIGLGFLLRAFNFPPMIYGGILVLIGTALLLSGLKYINSKSVV